MYWCAGRSLLRAGHGCVCVPEHALEHRTAFCAPTYLRRPDAWKAARVDSVSRASTALVDKVAAAQQRFLGLWFASGRAWNACRTCIRTCCRFLMNLPCNSTPVAGLVCFESCHSGGIFMFIQSVFLATMTLFRDGNAWQTAVIWDEMHGRQLWIDPQHQRCLTPVERIVAALASSSILVCLSLVLGCNMRLGCAPGDGVLDELAGTAGFRQAARILCGRLTSSMQGIDSTTLSAQNGSILVRCWSPLVWCRGPWWALIGRCSCWVPRLSNALQGPGGSHGSMHLLLSVIFMHAMQMVCRGQLHWT